MPLSNRERALQILRDILSDASDAASEDEEAAIANVIVTSETDSDSESDEKRSNDLQSANASASNLFGRGRGYRPQVRGRGRSQSRGRRRSTIGETEEEPHERSFIGKDGTRWTKIDLNNQPRGRIQQQNVLKVRPGPTAYSTSRVLNGSPLSAFRIFVDEKMLRHVRRCTNEEGKRATGNQAWHVTLEELEKFIGLIIARGIIGGRNIPIKELWSTSWGCAMFNKTMPRHRFCEIMTHLRFDMKTERRQNLASDKFCLASEIWDPFIENCQKAFIPEQDITVDEQLLPCKARCRFIQFMGNKPDKFGLKFWLAVDVENKYLFNGFPYLGKDDTRSADVSVATDVVMKLMKPLFMKGYNVTCDNYFTSLNLAKLLAKNQCSLVGTIRQNRREIPDRAKAKKSALETEVFKTTSDLGVTLTSYQCKLSKSVLVLSTLHPNVHVPTENNRKRKPEPVLFYNQTKAGVDVIDQMSRASSVKAASRRWPVHVFYNVLDMALINSWIIFKKTLNSNISRRQFIQRICEELTGHNPRDETSQDAGDADNEAACAIDKKRRTCSTAQCRNRTVVNCSSCQKPVCGKCSIQICKKCQ